MPDYDQSPSLQRDQTNDEMTTRLESGPETKPEPFVPNMDGPEIELAADYALANECLEEPERDVWKTIKSIFTRKKKKEQPDPEPEVVEKVVKKVKVVAVRKKTTVQSPETVKEPESSAAALLAHSTRSTPAFAVGAGVMVQVTWSLTALQVPLPAEISVRVTLPAASSAALGV